MSLPDADTQDASHAAEIGTLARHFQNLVMGHRVEDRIHHFPHLCPGRDCALARWMKMKDDRDEYASLKRSVPQQYGFVRLKRDAL